LLISIIVFLIIVLFLLFAPYCQYCLPYDIILPAVEILSRADLQTADKHAKADIASRMPKQKAKIQSADQHIKINRGRSSHKQAEHEVLRSIENKQSLILLMFCLCITTDKGMQTADHNKNIDWCANTYGNKFSSTEA
ncbi:hypothetical protein OTU49_001712, partial [Cherax quadricarinatus]